MPPYIPYDALFKKVIMANSRCSVLNCIEMLKQILKNPYFYAILICICLLAVLVGGALTYGGGGGVKKIEVPQIVQVQSTTTAEDETMDLLSASDLDGFWVVLSKDAKMVSLEKRCANCSKYYFNITQLEEIHSFMHSCYVGKSCKVQNWPNIWQDWPQQFFCVVCNPLIRMRTSNLHFCIDIDNEINSGFIGNYLIYPDVLNLLYTANRYFNIS